MAKEIRLGDKHKDDPRCHDPYMTLDEWGKFIDELKSEYSPDTKLFTDAGANNVTFYIELKE